MPKPIGWDTARDALEAGYERTQHRRDEDLPPLPAELTRGVVGSVLDSVAVHETVIESSGPAPPTPAEQVSRIAEQLSDRLETFPTEDPLLARLRAWQPERN